MLDKVIGCVAIAALSLGVAGCSGDDDKSSDKKKDKSESSASPSSVDPDKTSPEDLAKVPALEKGFAGAFKDVKFGDCPTKNGPVTVTAEITNPTKKAQDYVLVVSWINDTNDVMGRAVKSVKALGPDQSRELELTTRLKAPTKVTCTFNVSRGTLAAG